MKKHIILLILTISFAGCSSNTDNPTSQQLPINSESNITRIGNKTESNTANTPAANKTILVNKVNQSITAKSSNITTSKGQVITSSQTGVSYTASTPEPKTVKTN